MFGIAQDDRRVRKPGDQALRDDIRVPGDAANIAAMRDDPVIDDMAQMRKRIVVLDRTHMPDPSEGMQPDGEFVRW